MPTILTVTFNPSMDKSTTVPMLVAEKKMLCTLPRYEPGGGGINVARAIKKLGGNAIAYYLAGGDVGKKFTQLLADEHVETQATAIAESTRENFIVSDVASNQQYRFGMLGPTVSKKEWEACLKNIEQSGEVAYIVASGSLTDGVPTDIFARIAKIAHQKNARLIVDTSGEALKQAIEAGVYLIKPNLNELSALLGKKDLETTMAADAARTMLAKGRCEVVVVSMAAAGALLVTPDLTQLIAPPPVVKKSTVGAGDSMVAGMVWSLANGKNLTEAVQYGVACGTAATMNAGTALCRKEDADQLYELIKKADKKADKKEG